MAAVNGRAMRARGAAFEREVVRVLRAAGLVHAERSYGAGRPDDRGDIDGLPGYVVECKAHRALDLAGWMDEARREAARSGSVPVVVVKRRGKPAEESYVVLRLADWARVLRETMQ